MLGKYEILRKLAMGGMAEIYLARARGQAGFEKLVVIKRILPTVANDPKFVQMFLDEARLAATLQHPNIADVYEVGEHEGSPFFAMEFVHGQDVRTMRFAARKRNEQVPLAIALSIIQSTASALDHAHDRNGPDGRNLGLVHRDISTSNILVSYDGAIKLIDFGIARATNSAHQTQTGTLKGKIPYMAPEQCRGQALDRRSDIFSLGVVLYELTVGRRPFAGENDFQIMEAIVHRDAPPPSASMRDYPADLEAIAMKMLARNREERYQTLEAVLHDLEPFLQQHRLWVSPKQLSKYMRTMFANDVEGWDRAIEDGVTLAQHVAASVTGQSAQSQLLTPPSAFPAMMPLSEVMPAVRPSIEMQAQVEPPAPVVSRAASAPVLPEYPQLKPKSGRVFAILFGVAALGVGGYVGITTIQHAKGTHTEASPAPTADEPPTKMSETRTMPPPVTNDEVAGATTPAATPPPPPINEPVTAPIVPPVAAVVPPPADEPPKKSPGKRTPPPRRPPPVTVVKQPKEPPKETPKAPPPKDTHWTSDSPFLPPAP